MKSAAAPEGAAGEGDGVGCGFGKRRPGARRGRRARRAGLLLCALAFALQGPRPALAETDAADEPPAPVNDRCTLDWEGFCNYPSRLSDGRPETRVALREGSAGVIRWTRAEDVGLVYWEWTVPPDACTFDLLDESGAVLRSDVRFLEGVRGYLTVPEDCFGVRLTAGGDCELSEWHVYARGRMPDTVLLWEPAPDKCDLMLVVAHADDEMVMMGGIIPTYAAERGYRVQVVYCYVPELERVGEALAGLRSNGMDTLPVFFVTEDEKRLRFDEKITAEIRRFRPEVVVTHDIDGEYGNPGHVLVSRKVREAVEAAADPDRFPASAERFGVWQVKKLYLHLYPENRIRLDFDTPLAAFDGRTAFEMAQLGYGYHESQRDDWLTQLQSNRWDCRNYGLYASTVGPDVQKDDFLENIPPELLSNYVAPTPTPTPTPTFTSAPAPASTPTPAGTAAGRTGATGLWLGAGILAALACLWLLRRPRRR